MVRDSGPGTELLAASAMVLPKLQVNKLSPFFFFFLGCVGSLRAGFLVVSRRGYSSLRCGGFFYCGAWALGAQASVVAARRLSSCSTWALECAGFSSCGSRAVERRLSSCGTWAQLLCSMWDLPRPGLEPVSPALAGGFLTAAPPGKSPSIVDGHLSCFQFRAIINDIAKNISVHVFYGHKQAFLFGTQHQNFSVTEYIYVQIQQTLSNSFPKWLNQFILPSRRYECGLPWWCSG